MSASTFGIVGGGLGGAKTAEALRQSGFDGHIVVFADEQHVPYERPPLSKDYLAGKKKLDDFTTFDASWYRDHDVDLRLGVKVEHLDPSAHRVVLSDGSPVQFDKLLLATGSRSRHPSIPGSDAAGVHYLRTVEDASALDTALVEGASLVVIGGGWIGLEVAATARERGVDVTVIELAELPLMTVLGREAGAVFAQLHRDHDVELHLNARVAEIRTSGGTASGVVLDDGSVLAADVVLVATGAQPNIELAERAGLDTGGGGVLVNTSLRTSEPDIYAVGDIAAAWHPLYGTRIRTEHWANALKQPAVAAAAMLGEQAEYEELPYFFTDQYDLGMEYVGHAPQYDRVVFRGDVDSREFTAFWLDDANRVLAGMNVNIWDTLDDIKNLIRSQNAVDTEQLANTHHSLGELLTA